MPYAKFRNIKINIPNEFWNKDDLKTLKEVIKPLGIELFELKERTKHKVFQNLCYNSIRIGKNEHLLVFISPQNKNNPYLCVYNVKNNTYSTTIEYKDIMKFQYNVRLYDFQDKCRGIERPLALSYETQAIKDELQKIADDYDFDIGDE